MDTPRLLFMTMACIEFQLLKGNYAFWVPEKTKKQKPKQTNKQNNPSNLATFRDYLTLSFTD